MREQLRKNGRNEVNLSDSELASGQVLKLKKWLNLMASQLVFQLLLHLQC